MCERRMMSPGTRECMLVTGPGKILLSTLLLLWLIALHSEVACLDICSLSSEDDLNDIDSSSVIFQNSVPKGQKSAGRFTKVRDVRHWEDCVVVCCEQEDCNLMYFFNTTCYLIQCNASVADGCEPVRSGVNSTLVIVRKPVYQAISTDEPAAQPSYFVEQTCEYGMQQCPEHEECSLGGSTRSRHGKCQCVEGYQRGEDGVCTAVTEKLVTASTTSGDKAGGQEDQSAQTTPKPGTPSATRLTVSAGDNKVLQLPENSITLSAFVLPKAAEGGEYKYEWSLVSLPQGAETAMMEGKNTESFKLSNLIAGLYQLKVVVTGVDTFGEAFVNVTVLPPKRQNQRPVAIIKPASQQVKSENAFILDGSDSTDDDGIKEFHWEEVKGPLSDRTIEQNTQMLKLKDMPPGFYVFRLTVTDTDGETNSTTANVTVIKETDYPPKANAGSPVVIHLPQKSVTLCGNASTDDKGIASYEWIKKSDSLTADMTGVRTVCLQLNNLEVGDYTFTLKVTDTGGNTATSDVNVYVKPATNRPPEAKTVGEVSLMLPAEGIVLDGHNSSDDKGVVHYDWKQTGGPTSLTVSSGDQAVAMATGDITAGDYEFTLTVTDEEDQSSSAKLKVTVKKNENHPPVAHAGGERLVLLPVSVVTLDGSGSTDDRGIASYLWERDPNSLAAGEVVNSSDHRAVLQLANLVAGNYVFTLTVTDEQGLSSKDTASLVVKNGDDYKNLLELILDTDIHHFTEEDRLNVVKQLELLVHQSPRLSGTTVTVQSTEEEISTGYLRLTFFVRTKEQKTSSGVDIVHLLWDKLDTRSILSYRIVSLDTVLCQNNCSGHGQCDQRTKTCHCEAFWMPNVFKEAVYERESNCEWSILYVVIVCFLIIVGIIAGVWGVICCCRSKRCRLKTKKRHRYSLLREVEDEDGKDKLELMPKGKIQNSSVMMSESDFSSEEETLFVSSKPANGHLKPLNGVSRQHFKAQLRT